MPIPDYQSVMLPILQLASDGVEHRTRDAIAAVAKTFNLTDEELAKLNPSGMDYVFGNRFGWARTCLKKAGLIHYTGWGKFQITEAGKSLLAKNPAKIGQESCAHSGANCKRDRQYHSMRSDGLARELALFIRGQNPNLGGNLWFRCATNSVRPKKAVLHRPPR